MAKILKFEPNRLKYVPIGLRWVSGGRSMTPSETEKKSSWPARDPQQEEIKGRGDVASLANRWTLLLGDASTELPHRTQREAFTKTMEEVQS